MQADLDKWENQQPKFLTRADLDRIEAAALATTTTKANKKRKLEADVAEGPSKRWK